MERVIATIQILKLKTCGCGNFNQIIEHRACDSYNLNHIINHRLLGVPIFKIY